MVDTRKFSEFIDGGDLVNDDTTVGLRTGSNTKFSNPWTFLPDGTTGDRPTPSPSVNFRLRFNTTLVQYEYYDSVAGDWTQLAEDLSTVASIIGTVHQVKANGTVGTPTFGNVTLTTPQDIDTTSSPTFSNLQLTNPLLPQYGGTGLPNLPGNTLSLDGPTTFIGAHDINFTFVGDTNVNFPTSGTLATVGGTVSSIIGTPNEIIVSNPTGDVTLSTPQQIGLNSAVQFNSVQFNTSNAIYDANGFLVAQVIGVAGTPVNYLRFSNDSTGLDPAIYAQGSDTDVRLSLISQGDQGIAVATAAVSNPPFVIISGTGSQHTTSFLFSNTANIRVVTFPDSTMTVAGTSLALGGTNAALTADNGGIVYSNATSLAILAHTATAQQLLMSGASTTPQWSTTTYPLTNAINTINYASSANVMGSIAAANSSVLISGNTGVPVMSGALTNGQLIIGSTGASPTRATLTAGTGITISNGAGTITISGAGSGYSWTEVTGTSQSMAVNNGYIANNAGLVTLTLPSSASVGDTVILQGKGSGLFKIAQNSGQTIRFGNVSTTTGVGGSLTAVNQYNSIELLCITTNTDWSVLTGTQGSFTVV